jgi:hypothetical protein
MSRTVLRFFLATCICWIVKAESDISVQTTVPLSCVAHWNISSAHMEHIAYMWTHEHKVRNWLYKQTSTPVERNNDWSFANTSCAIIEYDTVVKVPQRFADFIPSRVTETHVQKQICASSNELTERLRFSKIMLLGSFTLQLKSTIDNVQQHAVFVSTGDIALPWFVQPVRQIIFGHLKKSILEYTNLLANSLCA